MRKRRSIAKGRVFLVIAACTGDISVAGDAEIPQVDVQCGVVYSLTNRNNNGINDEWERHFFGGLSSNPNLDPDHDGFSNYFEFLAGTSPVSGTDFIIQKLSKPTDGVMDFQWSSVVNRSYVVETSSNLSDWSASETITATSTECRYPIVQPQSGQIFARLRILPVK